MIKNIFVEEKTLDIKVDVDTVITFLNKEISSIKIEVDDNVKVVVRDFRIIDKSKTKIKLILNNNSTLIYNHSFINKEQYDLVLETKYKGLGSEVILNIHGINSSGNSEIVVNGTMGEKVNNILLENIKLINVSGGYGSIVPNITVSSSQVVANHKATIGTVSKDELMYLMSKGIKEKEAISLILNGFLINIYEDQEFITKVKELIIWSD